MDIVLITALLASGIRLGMAIGLSAIGEAISERAGVVNIGVEGIMLVGAATAAWGALASGSPWMGLAIAMLAGGCLAAFHALMVLRLGVNAFVSGIGLVIFGTGASSYLARLAINAAPIRALPTFSLSGFLRVPAIDPSLLDQSPLVYFALLAALLSSWILKRTAIGLEIRACGEDAEVSRLVAIPVDRLRGLCLVFGGMMAGAGGAYLTLVQVNAFVENMVAGRGFLAVACVLLAKQSPVGALAVAVSFGLAEAAEINLQTVYPDFPYQILAMLPYLAALIALVVSSRRRALQPL
jgi:general nucleoside transport system permease protein